jgi:hypothetical protein
VLSLVDLLISNPENTVASYEQNCQPLGDLKVSPFFNETNRSV